ncbi:MAG TPA: flagellin lysine-N-methylase [Firmicutes bacterium]|nr:flagellin lysine-N-methylase [Bacillota bacterium]
MSYTKIFRVPDYFPQFTCKCGDCRSTCCGGWGISLSLDEYLRLIGIDCTPELRRRLDTAFHIADNPSPERYALVTPRWDGHCPLQREDGLCMLQRECGEDMLPAVCRYYPRAPRTYPCFECSTSASCERTLELLFESDDPVRFVETELTFKLELPTPDVTIDADYYINMRTLAFTTISDRTLDFSARLKRLGAELKAYDSRGFDQYAPDSTDSATAADCAIADSAIADCSKLFSALASDSTTLSQYTEVCSTLAGSFHGSMYAALAMKYPKLDIYLEKLFCNHIFYKGFPCSLDEPRRHTLADEFAPLCAVYSLCIYVAVAALPDEPSLDDLVDVWSKLFRVIEHSRFDTFVSALMRRDKISPYRLLSI